MGLALLCSTRRYLIVRPPAFGSTSLELVGGVTVRQRTPSEKEAPMLHRGLEGSAMLSPATSGASGRLHCTASQSRIRRHSHPSSLVASWQVMLGTSSIHPSH